MQLHRAGGTLVTIENYEYSLVFFYSQAALLLEYLAYFVLVLVRTTKQPLPGALCPNQFEGCFLIYRLAYISIVLFLVHSYVQKRFLLGLGKGTILFEPLLFN